MTLDELREAKHAAPDEPTEMTLGEQQLDTFLRTLVGGSYTFFAESNEWDECVGATVYYGGRVVVKIQVSEDD